MANPSRRLFLAGAALANAAPALVAAKVRRPIVDRMIRQRADAQMLPHTDGWYYLTGSVREYDRLVLRRSRTIAGLSTAREAMLWRHQTSGPMSGT